MEAETPDADAGHDICMTLNDFLAVLDGEGPPAPEEDMQPAKKENLEDQEDGGINSILKLYGVQQKTLPNQDHVDSINHQGGPCVEFHVEQADENCPNACTDNYASNGLSGRSMEIVYNDGTQMDGLHCNWHPHNSNDLTAAHTLYEECVTGFFSGNYQKDITQTIDDFSQEIDLDMKMHDMSFNPFQIGMSVEKSSDPPGSDLEGVVIEEINGSLYNGCCSSVTALGDCTPTGMAEGATHNLLEVPQQMWSGDVGSDYHTFGQTGQFVPPQLTSQSDMMQDSESEEEEFCDASLSECLGSDFDTSSLCSLSDEKSQADDVCFKTESSIDSSPLPTSINSANGNFDVYLASTRDFNHDYTDKCKSAAGILKDHRVNTLSSASHTQLGLPRWNSTFMQGTTTECIILDADRDPDLGILEGSRNLSKNILPVDQIMFTNPVAAQICGLRSRSVDERLNLELALQDLSEPSSEATPPDGFLAVPLLKHQRMALAWMIQRETSSFNCCGGILADDQGLGKTVSAISLILMERPQLSRKPATKQHIAEELTLYVDDDDEGIVDAPETENTKHPRLCSTDAVCSTAKRETPLNGVKSRPASGTLVVCPTSVLRQWAEELQCKVTAKANLSFLVYHGSNRTKDPDEVAKYDVVLTTYAIVSMEVPKQPILDEEENDKQEMDGSPVEAVGKKRKNSKKMKDQKRIESLIESVLRPLARVSWFRVILDEAQSIKNYRTQVARACWGLRAKRRWCLSGTPIQNAVDDLYSYFRFLRYEPYSVYKSFCSLIKVPISRNPNNGYKKLQVVLKTVMLRRTKGTLLDGRPIINLPSKTINLMKVEFSDEERSFYSVLEAESREQFREYEAAGTVRQNYVNILLMLLRLRQACDHPLLVKGYRSSSSWRSTIHMAKKLPTEKQRSLLSCLEAYSAVCAICNDIPEDAVVTICGHVFCNQCICEHLTGGDDSICPTSSCKTRLNATSLFSRGTLECSLNGVTIEGPSSDLHSENLNNSSFESSKVKAAIQILSSLPSLNHGQQDECAKSVPSSSSQAEGENSIYSNEDLPSQYTEKAIVFSQWTSMLDLMEVHLKRTSINYRRLDGTMSIAARDKAVKDFKTIPEVTVIIMSLKAASLGLNMVAANHVLLLDLWWNPTTEDQAIDRAHRIGQTRPVTVSRLTVNNTVEDRIIALQETKRKLVSSAFGEDRSGARQTRLTLEDLQYIFADRQ